MHPARGTAGRVTRDAAANMHPRRNVGLKRLGALWTEVRDSLWFFPALLTLGAAVLAFLMVELDTRDVLPDRTEPIWLYTGSSAGARGVLTAIASGLITVTGVVFSVTIVALQLASSQYTPRVLRNFAADRPSQLVLGVFIGTFTYALLVLRVVRGEDPVALDEADYFVPHLAIVVAVVLTLVSIACLIFFIDHLARSIQASVILERVTRDTLRTMERLVPEQVGDASERDVEAATPRAQAAVVTTRESGYVQAIDPDALSDLLAHDALTIRLDREVGEFVLPGAGLATVWPATISDDGDVARSIRRAYVLGMERTHYLDVEHGVIELVDIAVKTLSPAVNDPTTAVLCVDRLAEVLLALARRAPPGRVRRSSERGGVLILPSTQFDRVTDTALDPLRHFGADNPRFAIAMLDRLRDLATLLPEEAKPPVARQVTITLDEARRRIDQPADLQQVEAAGARALRALGVSDGGASAS
jgi:uncharacterized membrane protein